MQPSHFVLLVAILTGVFFASGRFRLDFVALLALLALVLGDILTPEEAFAGFGSPLMILVAGLMVLGESLDRTGVAHAIGRQISRFGGSDRTRATVLLMLSAGLLGTVMSSTAVVAIFIPIIFRISSASGFSPSQLLMPTSFAAMISGMLTLIATPPNLIASDALGAAGYERLTFFSFLPIGICMLLIGTVYMVTVGHRWLARGESNHTPHRQLSLADMWRKFAPELELRLLHIPTSSPLCNQSIKELRIEQTFSVRVLRLAVGDEGSDIPPLKDANSTDVLVAGTFMRVSGKTSDLERFIADNRLQVLPYPRSLQMHYLNERGAAMVMVHPESRFIGKSIRQANLRKHFNVHVLGFQRDGKPIESFSDLPVRGADILFVVGPWSRIASMGNEQHDFVLLEMPAEFDDIRPASRRAPLAIVILLAMVILSVLQVAPISIIVLTAALAVVGCKCLTAAEAYRSISWNSLVLLAGMLPLTTALERTGNIQALTQFISTRLDGAGPLAAMSVLFLVASSLSLFLSNTATAIMLVPVAIKLAEELNVSPYPFAVSVAIGVSAAFASPVASPVITLVVEPGKYRFLDFVKVGLPLLFLAFFVNLVITPWLYPF